MTLTSPTILPAAVSGAPGQPAASPTSVDPAAYKQGMRRLASGVTIIATEYQGERFGLLSTGVSSVAADPATLLICINQSASGHDPVERSGRFCVNLLRQGDEELAGRFSSSKHRATRFTDREWCSLVTGAPALAGCLASFDCTVVQSSRVGTHTVFFGSVVDVRLWSDVVDPLLYWNGGYQALALARVPTG